MSTSNTHYLLAIDPGAAAGWALFVDGQLTAYGPAQGDSFWGFVNAMKDHMPAVATLEQARLAECVIEQGWSNGTKGALTLGQRRGIAQAAAEYFDFRKTVYIPSATWQNGLHGSIKGKDTKQLALDYVREKYQISNIDHNQAEAICLGTYFLGARHSVPTKAKKSRRISKV